MDPMLLENVYLPALLSEQAEFRDVAPTINDNEEGEEDVMEQYAAGHVDLLGRVKTVQTRLDQILGKQGSKSKDVYASKISLASRVVKIERQVDDVESKLDNLIELYTQDRKRILSLPICPDAHSNNPNLPPLPPNPPSGAAPILLSAGGSGHSGLKPKPCLVDKQFSEPNSPIAKSFEEQPVQKRPPIQRGYSDLGNRMKKRVTLSSIPTQYHHNDRASTMGGDHVVIVVPGMDDHQVAQPLHHQSHSHQICIDAEVDVEQNSPKTNTESSISMLMNEIDEDYDEEDLDLGTEITDSPPIFHASHGDWGKKSDNLRPWYCEPELEDIEDTSEDTALLRVNAPKMEIIVTPISPVRRTLNNVSSSHDLARMGQEKNNNNNNSSGKVSTISSAENQMSLLTPDMQPKQQRTYTTEDI